MNAWSQTLTPKKWDLLKYPSDWNLGMLAWRKCWCYSFTVLDNPRQTPHPSPSQPPIPLISPVGTKLTRPVRISWVSVTLYPTALNISPLQCSTSNSVSSGMKARANMFFTRGKHFWLARRLFGLVQNLSDHQQQRILWSPHLGRGILKQECKILDSSAS